MIKGYSEIGKVSSYNFKVITGTTYIPPQHSPNQSRFFCSYF